VLYSGSLRPHPQTLGLAGMACHEQNNEHLQIMTLKSLVTLIPGVFVYVQVYSSCSGIHISKNVSVNCLTDSKIFQILMHGRVSIDILSECIFTNLVHI
jgi:hypothetical protein